MSFPTHGRIRKKTNNDGSAVHNNTEGHNSTVDVRIAEVRWHLITHTNGTFPQSLTKCQLQVEYENVLNCEHDKVRDQECTCERLKAGILQYFLHSSLHTIKWQFINYSAQRLYVSVKNVSQRHAPNTFRLSHKLIRMQGSVLGYENRLYLNKAKLEWVLQCILWVLWLQFPWK
jgi:hypothetical protein